MKKFRILDCTLRDGGYYTNWDFENSLVGKYMDALMQLPVDIIEVGYRSTPQEEYAGKYFYLPGFAVDFLDHLNKGKKLAVMINEKSTELQNLPLLLSDLKGRIQIIRIAASPDKMSKTRELTKEIRNMGFEVAVNWMYMSTYYQSNEFFTGLQSFNGIADYITVVDSYGGMLPSQITELIQNVKSASQAKIGFHGHNNLELAFANSLAAIDAGSDIIDCTILGMGRGAGNLKTELLLTSILSEQKTEFDFNILSGLVELWSPLLHHYAWGTNLPYMFSGAHSLPQKDVMEWVTQRFYSFNSIVRALHNQKNGGADNLKLAEFIPDRTFKNVIIIGGGDSARVHADAIIRFAETIDNVCIVHASSKNAKFYEDLQLDQFFCLVGSEGRRMEDVFRDLGNFRAKCVLPPYPRKMGTYIPDNIQSRAFELKQVNFTDLYQDSHTALALQTALELFANHVYLAGYDGYAQDSISLKEQGLIRENEYLFSDFRKVCDITSLFTTKYSVQTESIYTLIR